MVQCCDKSPQNGAEQPGKQQGGWGPPAEPPGASIEAGSSFCAPAASQLPTTAAQDHRGESFRGPGSQILRFQPERGFPASSILPDRMMGSWIWEASGAARQLPDAQVLANPHSHIPGSSATQWGDSSKAGIQKLPVPVDLKQPTVWIALWQVRNLWVQTASEAQRQLARLSQGFKTNSVFCSKLTTKFWNISIGYKLNTPSLFFFPEFSYYSPTHIPWVSWILEAHH